MALAVKKDDWHMRENVNRAVSDMFFNMEHAKYSALMQQEEKAKFSDLQEAIENDAAQMSFWLKELGFQVPAEDLVIDFFERV